MYNYFKILIISILILLILFTIHGLINVPSSKKARHIETTEVQAIKIPPLRIKGESSLKNKQLVILPIEILSKLKIATEQSKEAIIPSKQEQSNKILASLENEISQQEIQTVIPKNIIPKKVIIKKIIAKKKLTPKTKKVNVLKKKIVSKKKRIRPKKRKYVQKTKSTSKIFKLKEEVLLADAYYFKPIEVVEKLNSPALLGFVETLGIVSVSEKYENEFSIPKKVEIEKEDIGHISSTNIEMKNLEFADTLGVIYVSESFEITESKRY